MVKLKVGDLVECVWNDQGTSEYVGKKGKIINVRSDKYPYGVSFCHSHFCAEELKKIKFPFKVGNIIEWIGRDSQWKITEIDDKYFHGECLADGRGGKDDIENFGDYKLVKNNNRMQKVSIMMKKLLDKDTQILVKAGFIDGDLNLTTEGLHALNSILFATNKADLVVLAQEAIDEEEKNK
jgi:hypothetical protein